MPRLYLIITYTMSLRFASLGPVQQQLATSLICIHEDVNNVYNCQSRLRQDIRVQVTKLSRPAMIAPRRLLADGKTVADGDHTLVVPVPVM